MIGREKIGGMNRTLSSSSSSSTRCKDCGNQAKKDCLHMRCRTCCKGRGFHCQTHVKSTWIPISRKRTRDHTMHPQQHQISASAHQQLQYEPNPNRSYREYQALGFQEGIDLPGETSFPAVFRCVRVSSMDKDNVVDQYAYQTSVSIGGRIFTGILYDQGPVPEGNINHVTGESSSPGTGTVGLLQQHNFITRTTTPTPTGDDPSPFLPFTIGTSQFFHYPKS
ncbi:hypothetical protein OROMI_028227 [Orobanche minor]